MGLWAIWQNVRTDILTLVSYLLLSEIFGPRSNITTEKKKIISRPGRAVNKNSLTLLKRGSSFLVLL